MSGAIDVHSKKRVLIVAANPGVSPATGWPVGFWWAELTHPYWVFTEAGYEVEIASPKGGDLLADGYSDPGHESGYSAADILSLGFKTSPAHGRSSRAPRPSPTWTFCPTTRSSWWGASRPWSP